jgi:hypothetical protein
MNIASTLLITVIATASVQTRLHPNPQPPQPEHETVSDPMHDHSYSQQLSPILFRPGSSSLSPEARAILREVAMHVDAMMDSNDELRPRLLLVAVCAASDESGLAAARLRRVASKLQGEFKIIGVSRDRVQFLQRNRCSVCLEPSGDSDRVEIYDLAHSSNPDDIAFSPCLVPR